MYGGDRGRSSGGGRGGRGGSGGRGYGRFGQGQHGPRRGGGRGQAVRDYPRGGGGRGGSRGGERSGGRHPQGGRGGRGRGPNLSGLQSVLTNIIPATVAPSFVFYQYVIDCKNATGEPVHSRTRRSQLFFSSLCDNLLQDLPSNERNEVMRSIFWTGNTCFASRPIPGLEELPKEMSEDGGDFMTCVLMTQFSAPVELALATAASEGEGEVSFDPFRCNDCTGSFANEQAMLQHCRDTGHSPLYGKADTDRPPPAPAELFITYVNHVLQKALGERLARWGRSFVDPSNFQKAQDRRGNYLGVHIFNAYSCHFGLLRPDRVSPVRLALTCDLGAKIIRTKSLLHELYGEPPQVRELSLGQQEHAKRKWIGQVVIYKNERKCYDVVDLDFTKTPDSFDVPNKGISHTRYFREKKVYLSFPSVAPMVAVIGRRNQVIFLPAELVMGNDLDPRVREQLPQVASFSPPVRNEAIQKIRGFLTPGAEKSSRSISGLLPSVGIVLESERISTATRVLAAPRLIAAGVQVPERNAENWAPVLNRATFSVSPNQANVLSAVVVRNRQIRQDGARRVFDRICGNVNLYNASFRLDQSPLAIIEAGDGDDHWRKVENYLRSPVPDNVIIIDFCKPTGQLDTAYPVIKQILGRSGFLSQFVNFRKHPHDAPVDRNKSEICLKGVARQILQKAGVRLWWVHIPRSLPMPAAFVGIDVSHKPMEYNPQTQRRGRKQSCAAIVVEVVDDRTHVPTRAKLYSQTIRRQGGMEFELGDAMADTVATALRRLATKPASVVVWRDGIADTQFEINASEEIEGVRRALTAHQQEAGGPRAHLAYIVCQKRIATKFFAKDVPGFEDGSLGAPPGSLVQGLQSLTNDTFYINGRAPPYSTPKPVRYVVVESDPGLDGVSLPQLTWDQCHSYPNWTGPVKVPSVCLMAHKLSEQAGSMPDYGESINSDRFTNKLHFL